MVFETIKKDGYFCYDPRYWRDENIDKKIKQLKESNQIQSLTNTGIEFMNSDYIYVAIPAKVKVVIEDGISKLIKI